MVFPWSDTCKALTAIVNPLKAYDLKGWTIVASFYGFNSTGKSQFLYFKSQLEQNHNTFAKERRKEIKHGNNKARTPVPTTTLSHKPSKNFKSTRLSTTFSSWNMCDSLLTLTKVHINHCIFLRCMCHTRFNKTQNLASTDDWIIVFGGCLLLFFWHDFYDPVLWLLKARKSCLQVNAWREVAEKFAGVRLCLGAWEKLFCFVLGTSRYAVSFQGARDLRLKWILSFSFKGFEFSWQTIIYAQNKNQPSSPLQDLCRQLIPGLTHGRHTNVKTSTISILLFKFLLRILFRIFLGF